MSLGPLYPGVHVSVLISKQNKIIVLYLLGFVLFFYTASVDADAMPRIAAFHMGLHCLPKHSLGDTN